MRKSDINIEETKTNLERMVLENGETMTSLCFALGKNFTSGNLRQFYTANSSLSECSYNTILGVCAYLGCEPEDILEENEANGLLANCRSFSTIYNNVTPFCHTYTSRNAENYFQAFLSRNDLSFAWIIEHPSGRIVLRAGRFKAVDNHLEGGVAYEAVYNSDLSDLSKLYISHQGVKTLTLVPQKEDEKNGNTSDVGGQKFDSGMLNSEELENSSAGGQKFDSGTSLEGSSGTHTSENIEAGGQNFDSGTSSDNTSEAGGSNFDRGSLNFSFRSQVEGVIEVNRPVPVMRNKKLFASLDDRKLQVLPYDDLSGKFLEFIKELYNSGCGFEEMTHADFMRAIYSILSPFKNKQMRKELKK